ncbi:MAG: glycine cleavage system protein GcvH [Nitrospinae bacterium]|nr:glycine cleavage system protein GcvH [Nitrospinota bacterium]
MEVPKDLLYTEEHEWIRVKGNKGVIGITHFAQDQLGDVVFVELPQKGATVSQSKTFGVVESVKTVSDLYGPVGGAVTAVNQELESHPEQVNSDPYGKGWMIEVEISSAKELENLLSPEKYAERIKEETH